MNLVMGKMTKSVFLACISILGIGTLSAQAAYKPAAEAPPRELAIEMGAPFHDHAILQRGMKVPVWGWSKPGTKVTVEFRPQEGAKQKRQQKSAVAGDDGKWMIELEELSASFEPAVMTITESTGRKEVLKDILVGEVWMCSGQSNMQWMSGACIVGGKLIPEIKARVAAGEEQQPIIREVKVTNKFSSLYPSRRVKAKWSDNWMNFSAIAFAFAYDIAKEVKVPVGIVNCAFSTTMIQAWVPREGFAAGQDAYTRTIYREILESDVSSSEHKAAWAAYEKELLEWARESGERTRKGLNPKARPGVPGNLNGNRDATWMCNGKIMPMVPYAIRGAIWNQGYASQSEGVVYRNNLHSLVRGWREVFNKPDLPVYFHQFYSGKSGSDGLSLSNTAEMRLGTWLAHLDIPNAAMASQIDITGGIHYSNKAVPGQRLARHALKNQYPSLQLSTGGKAKDLIANGPMYSDYKVHGNKLIVGFEHAQGLQVGQSMTVRSGYADPVALKDSEDKVTLFYLADKEHTWHRAEMQIEGETIVLTAQGVNSPKGVAYGWEGVGGLPSIYNEAMLPLTPFMVFDHKLVVSDQWDLDYIKIPGVQGPFELTKWPMDHVEISGEKVDPASYGLREEHRRLLLLAPQFANNAVIQSGVSTRLYGKALPDSVVSVTFGDFKKELTMGQEQTEWEMTIPALPATAEPRVLHAVCTLHGQIAHERKLVNIVVGDVWYVAAIGLDIPAGPGVPRSGPAPLSAWTENPQLRMFKSFAWGLRSEEMPSRFKMNASGKPASRAFARWSPTIGLAKELAQRIHAKTGNPVGIVIVSGDSKLPELKSWVGYEFLSQVPQWAPDAKQLMPRYAPDPQAFMNNAKQYLESWSDFWARAADDPSFESGNMPAFPGAARIETSATKNYNQAVCSFSPGNFKAIVCLPSKAFVADDGGAGFGAKLSVMANCWKDTFARGNEVVDPCFVYAMPSKKLAPKITAPADIKGQSAGYEVTEWPKLGSVKGSPEDIVSDELEALLDTAVKTVYE